MIALPQMSGADEFVKWMVLLMIAGVVALFLATRIAGADSTQAFFPEDGPISHSSW